MLMKILLAVFFAFYFFFSPGLEKSYADSISLSVYPPIIEITAQPGTTITSPISIANLSDHKVSLDIKVLGFVPKGENGQVEIIDLPKDDTLGKDIYFTLEGVRINQLNLRPRQKETVLLNLNIPSNSNQSEYYFSILFISNSVIEPETANKNSATSQVNLGIGTNLILSIGKTQAKGTIEEFSSSKLIGAGPVTFTVRVRNQGKNSIYPQGYILIQNMFGQTIGKIDLTENLILKDSVRYIPRNWNEKFLLGSYKANLYVRFSDDQPYLQKTATFIGFPMQMAAALLLAVTLVLVILSRIKLKSRIIR